MVRRLRDLLPTKLDFRGAFADVLVFALLVFPATFWLESRLSEKAEVQENLRFIRQLAMDENQIKPLAGLNLHQAYLNGLDVSCDREDMGGLRSPCADLELADLTGARMSNIGLQGAKLQKAKLRGADLTGANLNYVRAAGAIMSDVAATGAAFEEAELLDVDFRGADLTSARFDRVDFGGSDLTGANLSGARLVGANLSRATLSGTTIVGPCFDASTRWPQGYTLPRLDSAACVHGE